MKSGLPIYTQKTQQQRPNLVVARGGIIGVLILCGVGVPLYSDQNVRVLSYILVDLFPLFIFLPCAQLEALHGPMFESFPCSKSCCKLFPEVIP